MAITYKAALYFDDGDKGHIEIVDKILPECGDDDVIVKNLIAGICGADYLAYAHGDGPSHMLYSGQEFGHEMVSEVIAVGKNVKGIEVGDWVFPNMGYAHRDRGRMATVGGFSEYLYLPKFTLEGRCDIPVVDLQPSAIKLDKSLGLKNLVLMEPFAVGGKAAKQMEGQGTTAVVIGAGIIGMSAALMLKHYGYEKVMIIDFSDFRLENARSFGLLICNPQHEDVEQSLKDAFGARGAYGGMKCGAEVFIDCIGVQGSMDYFNKYAGVGAKLSIVGTHHKPPTINALSVCFNQQHIMGCGSYPYDKSIADTSALVRSGVDLSKLVTHEFSLEDIDKAMATHGDANSAQKVVIVYP